MLKLFFRHGLRLCLPTRRGQQADDSASSEQQARLLALIEALPRRHREAFVLHRFEGLSYKEIATRMGTSSRMVEHYIRMTMRACRHDPARFHRVDGAMPRSAGSYV